MIQEEKQLLLKDLSARLPYRVIINTTKGDGVLDTIQTCCNSVVICSTEKGHEIIDCVKPYLRPLSSITKEEELHIKLNLGFYLHDGVFDNVDIFATSGIYDRDGNYYPPEKCRYTVQITIYKVLEFLHYLHSHHLDYRGLIEKGLALEAPEGMYKVNDNGE